MLTAASRVCTVQRRVTGVTQPAACSLFAACFTSSSPISGGGVELSGACRAAHKPGQQQPLRRANCMRKLHRGSVRGQPLQQWQLQRLDLGRRSAACMGRGAGKAAQPSCQRGSHLAWRGMAPPPTSPSATSSGRSPGTTPPPVERPALKAATCRAGSDVEERPSSTSQAALRRCGFKPMGEHQSRYQRRRAQHPCHESPTSTRHSRATSTERPL